MTNAELAILHLLLDKPRHGYEIEEVIEERGMREWTAIGFSSIYYLLNKLEKAGMVTKQAEDVGRGPARKVFSLTPAGIAALREGTLASLSGFQGDYQSLLMGLANLPLLSREEALAALREHRDGLAARQEHIASRRQSQQPLAGHVETLFDYSLTMIDARLSWIGQFVEQIESNKFSLGGP
jgi:DNA-binding PadR family transcriptional regulator